MLTILFLMFTLTLMFFLLSHPMSFGLILLVQTLMTSLISGTMNFNFWFSYIIFLIMVGGMMILFIYMTSVASNEKFKFSLNMTLMITLIIMLILTTIFIDNFFFNLSQLNYTINLNKFNNNLSMSKYIIFPMNKIMLMIIMYLLVTLIAVVKITNINYGPLRQKF
uniref:NADH dehydrogenase subunit 6 n=1 Tax=Allotraeus orientalis TaxID=2690021 RepID=UPI001F1322BC|nr:NADH dehydrogenase subunit 6 [Allotraeus orientalis]UKQ56286.1 NADH dehydrogenase subunit 6 [Allotraeus orientalis]